MTELRLRDDALEWREIEDEVIAVDVRTSTYLSTNGSGTVLWRALAEGATREQLIAALQTSFGVETARAEEDVDQFVSHLRDRELLA
jgi:hypothetical protein